MNGLAKILHHASGTSDGKWCQWCINPKLHSVRVLATCEVCKTSWAIAQKVTYWNFWNDVKFLVLLFYFLRILIFQIWETVLTNFFTRHIIIRLIFNTLIVCSINIFTKPKRSISNLLDLIFNWNSKPKFLIKIFIKWTTAREGLKYTSINGKIERGAIYCPKKCVFPWNSPEIFRKAKMFSVSYCYPKMFVSAKR